MTRNTASVETIDVLIKNAKSTILDSERLLKNTELIKLKKEKLLKFYND